MHARPARFELLARADGGKRASDTIKQPCLSNLQAKLTTQSTGLRGSCGGPLRAYDACKEHSVLIGCSNPAGDASASLCAAENAE